jgi:segregation and condensation protein B
LSSDPTQPEDATPAQDAPDSGPRPAEVAQASPSPGRQAEPASSGSGRAEEAPAPSVSPEELSALQAAEEAKEGDPALEEVESAEIDVTEEKQEKEEPFEKLAAEARRLGEGRVRTVLETLLFLAERPLTAEELRQVTGLEVERIAKALDQLSGQYREGLCGLVLHEVAGGWQLRTSPLNAAYARRFLKVKPQRLTRAALETLAIVAYRQPVTRPEVEDVRGVDCGAVLKALLERRLVRILGKKEEPGRPILYGTTREFLEFFALKDLASLPTLREFHELSEEHRSIVEKEAPPEAAPIPGIAGIIDDLSDPAARAALEAKRAEGDAALEELEKALADADEKSRAVSEALGEGKKKDQAADGTAPLAEDAPPPPAPPPAGDTPPPPPPDGGEKG